LSAAGLRLFVAIRLPPAAAAAAAAAGEAVCASSGVRGRVPAPENLHLTLKFLGAVDAAAVGAITAALAAVRLPAFPVRLGALGHFRQRQRAVVVWAALMGDGVGRLQQAVDTALAGQFPRNDRFCSHVTVLRAKRVADYAALAQHLQETSVAASPFTVAAFALIRSELGAAGAVHTEIARYPLAAG
jgi:2'-5' RNA ligase